MCVYGASVLKKANEETPNKHTSNYQATLSSFDWKLKLLTRHYKKHTTAPKKVLCVSLSTTSADFFSFIIFYVLYFGAPFNNRLRGNTESSVVDTGVSLSTHTSPISSTPLGRLISCWARKWEEGQGSWRAWSDDVTAGNKDSDCCRWNEQAGEWVRGQG